MTKGMQFVVWALCAIALSGCYATMSGRNAAGSYEYTGRHAGDLVTSTAHATVVTADANAYATVSDAGNRRLASQADYDRAESLTDLQAACNARLTLASQASKEEKFRCRRIQDQQYNLEVLDRSGAWMPAYSFGGDGVAMFAGASMLADMQNGSSGIFSRRLKRVEADMAATRNRQRAVEGAVDGLNQDVYDATGK